MNVTYILRSIYSALDEVTSSTLMKFMKQEIAYRTGLNFYRGYLRPHWIIKDYYQFAEKCNFRLNIHKW